MTKIKKHIKRKYIKPVQLTEEEKALVETERQYACAFSHQLGEILSKHLKKKLGNKEVTKEEIFKSDAYASFLNDLQLMMINTFGLSAEEIINCNTELLPPKLNKLNITTDEHKACKKAMTNIFLGSDLLQGMAKLIEQGQPEESKQIMTASRNLSDAARWLGTVYKITEDCLDEPEIEDLQ